MRNRIICPACAGLLAVLAAAGAPFQDVSLPDGKGKATVKERCIGCHDLDVVTVARRTQAGWRINVADMISRGAEVSDDEAGDIVAYLTKYFGKVNVNAATAPQLQEFLNLGMKEAQAIIAFRTEHGKIKDFDQLKSVPGIDANKLQQKRSLIAFAD